MTHQLATDYFEVRFPRQYTDVYSQQHTQYTDEFTPQDTQYIRTYPPETKPDLV